MRESPYIKVAEILINPFGDDDDDFDCNHIVDSNYERSRAIVTAQEEEEEEKEVEEEMPECLPHTVESYRHQEVLFFAFKLVKSRTEDEFRHQWFCRQTEWWWGKNQSGQCKVLIIAKIAIK